jgi:hypothetical protein
LNKNCQQAEAAKLNENNSHTSTEAFLAQFEVLHYFLKKKSSYFWIDVAGIGSHQNE